MSNKIRNENIKSATRSKSTLRYLVGGRKIDDFIDKNKSKRHFLCSFRLPQMVCDYGTVIERGFVSGAPKFYVTPLLAVAKQRLKL